MMKEQIKQIMPAPGWKVLICRSAEHSIAHEVPVVGWGVVEFTNDAQDCRDRNCPDKFTEVELLIFYDEHVWSLRLCDELHITSAVFAPGEEIQQGDKDGLAEEARDWYRQRIKQRESKVAA